MTSQPRRLSSCHRHPTATPVTGFCASCLRERLASIDPATRQELPSGPPTAVLRRSKSCSGGSGPSASVSDPPRRKSCDVRARGTLWDLFNLDDDRKSLKNRKFEVEVGNLGFELREEDENENDNDGEGEEIRASEEAFAPNVDIISNGQENEIIEELIELKTMKEFIDLEFQSKKKSTTNRKSIWDAASLFTKKLRKWRRKQKMKKDNNNGDGGLVDVEKLRGRRWRETQSEIGEYGFFGRRSCDTDPRLSVDAATAGRYSFDEARASWDGYLIGKTYPRVTTPMVSVVEDVKDVKLEVNADEGLGNEEEMSPGGSAQTKDYYSESISSLSKRRRSFDRSNSHRKGGVALAASAAEVDELKLISNAKVSPATSELFYGAKLLITDTKCVKDGGDDNLESVESADKNVNQKGFRKLSKWHKVRHVFDLIHRRSERKCESKEKYVGGGDVVVDRPFAESWEKLRRVTNGEANVSGSVSSKLIRSYSVSCRNPCKITGLFHNMSGAETKDNGVKRREELLVQQNRSAKYSPNNLDNGLLRFYLTPLRSYRRSKSGNSKPRHSHSIARTVL